MRFRPLALLAVPCLAAPAFADSLPSLVPSHDVSGTYVSASPDSSPSSFDVSFSKAANMLKIVPADGGAQGSVIYNIATQDATVLMAQTKQYMEISGKNSGPGSLSELQALQNGASSDANGDSLSVTREGGETIAGHACDDYKVVETDKDGTTTSTVCITGDHVLLSSVSSDGTTLKAQSISYDGVPASAFSIPAGYTKFAMPVMPGMPSMPGMMGQGQ